MDLECAVSELVLISSKTVSPTIILKMMLLRSTYEWLFLVTKDLYVVKFTVSLAIS